ncbi:MAG: protein kinase, partial [Acidobacteriales bacterium]|nr:protein kinase [Terriglobales bacterium]
MATRLGRYEIDGELGRGAMGVVYRALDPKIDRMVAIKTISLAGQDPEEEQEYRERFVLEAKAAGRLSHPGIVTIYDVGEEEGSRTPYIVMEFVRGESLKKLLGDKGRKIPLESALQLAQELAEALNYAHTQGVVHRDIKPANILVTAGCHAKIADFGIAKLNHSNMTVAGRVLGSPAYMAPEQLAGEPVDARSDLFSLGVVLYSMLTGYGPFQGNSAATVVYKVVNRDPLPVSAFDAELPMQLDLIIARAIAKDPAQRYQSGAELARDIKTLREGGFSRGGKLQAESFGDGKRSPEDTQTQTSTNFMRSVMKIRPAAMTDSVPPAETTASPEPPKTSATPVAAMTASSVAAPVAVNRAQPGRRPVPASLHKVYFGVAVLTVVISTFVLYQRMHSQSSSKIVSTASVSSPSAAQTTAELNTPPAAIKDSELKDRSQSGAMGKGSDDAITTTPPKPAIRKPSQKPRPKPAVNTAWSPLKPIATAANPALQPAAVVAPP